VTDPVRLGEALTQIRVQLREVAGPHPAVQRWLRGAGFAPDLDLDLGGWSRDAALDLVAIEPPIVMSVGGQYRTITRTGLVSALKRLANMPAIPVRLLSARLREDRLQQLAFVGLLGDLCLHKPGPGTSQKLFELWTSCAWADRFPFVESRPVEAFLRGTGFPVGTARDARPPRIKRPSKPRPVPSPPTPEEG
jgi:hypothetical protein